MYFLIQTATYYGDREFCVFFLIYKLYKLNYHKLNMKEWFIKWGYPESAIDKEMKKFRFSEQDQKSKKVEKGVPFVVRYSYRNEICTAHDCIYMDDVEQKFLE